MLAFAAAILFSSAAHAVEGPAVVAPTIPKFDAAAWQKDYAYLKQQLQAQYANLAWFASTQGGIDLPQVDRLTIEAMQHARTDAQALAALRYFIAAFHDGHLVLNPAIASGSIKVAEPPVAALDNMDASAACAAIGVVATSNVAFSLPIESLDSFTLAADGMAQAFRSGLVSTTAGTRISIVRIPRFREGEYPDLCQRAFAKLKVDKTPITTKALNKAMSEAWFPVLAGRLKYLKEHGANALIVDVGGNGGGNDMGDWSVRLFTQKPVHSPRLLVAAGPLADGYYDEQLTELRDAVGKAEAHANLAPVVRESIAQFEAYKAALATRACDLSWVWHEQRTWDPAGCSRLAPAGFASGARDYMLPVATADADFVASAYWPVVADKYRGAWNGAVYVLTDQRVGSAAEAFVASMRDNGIARIVGTATAGSGCGNMQEARLIILPHSRLSVHAPDCVRLRAYGSDEVMGIAPDLPVLAMQGESARARAERLIREVEVDLSRNRSASSSTNVPP